MFVEMRLYNAVAVLRACDGASCTNWAESSLAGLSEVARELKDRDSAEESGIPRAATYTCRHETQFKEHDVMGSGSIKVARSGTVHMWVVGLVNSPCLESLGNT